MLGVRPAEQFYAWLLANGKTQEVEVPAKRLSQRSLEWLPGSLRARVQTLIEGRSRIAQECLNYEILTKEFSRRNNREV